jgi:hypothetical protein
MAAINRAIGKNPIMTSVKKQKFGLAWALTGALFYVGCVLVMWTVGKEGSVLFFNSLLHGIDVSSIIRVDMPWWEMVMGVIEIFILGWLIGATLASIYKHSVLRKK